MRLPATLAQKGEGKLRVVLHIGENEIHLSATVASLFESRSMRQYEAMLQSFVVCLRRTVQGIRAAQKAFLREPATQNMSLTRSAQL